MRFPVILTRRKVDFREVAAQEALVSVKVGRCQEMLNI